jgi:ribose transport system permease protein
MLIALVMLCTVLATSNDRFLSQENIVSTSRQIAMLGIFAIGMAFVVISGGIDLSVGSVVGLTGVIIAKLCAPESSGDSGGMAMNLSVGIPIALGIALAIGLIQGLLITRLGLQPFIVTLGFMLLLRGVSQTIAKGGNIYMNVPAFRQFVRQGIFEMNGQPVIGWPIVMLLGIAIIAAYVLHLSVFGRYLYAIGGNRDAAAYSGIPVKNVECITYVISAGLAGVAGVVYCAFEGQMSQSVGQGHELPAIAAVVLGGISLRGGEGTILGVIIGSFIMRVVDNGINMFRIEEWRPNENWRNIIIGAVILIAVIIDQFVHIFQARRRTRKAGAAAASIPAALPPG